MENLYYRNDVLPLSTNTVDWTPVGDTIGEYANVSLSPNTPLRLSIKREDKGNEKRILVKVRETFMPDAGTTIYPLQPYENSCHLVASYDKRYATLSQIKQTAITLLTTLLWQNDAALTGPFVLERILRGEN